MAASVTSGEGRGSSRELLCPEGVGGAPAAEPAPALPVPVRPVAVEPLTASQARLHMTVSPEFLEKLEAARLALSHSLPGASAEDVLSAGLDLLLQRDAKRKGLVEGRAPRRREEAAVPGAAYIPAAVRREVWTRDGGAAAGRSTQAACAARASGSSSTTGSCGWTAACRPSPTPGCSAQPITGWPRASGWATGSMDRYCRDPRQGELGGANPNPNLDPCGPAPGLAPSPPGRDRWPRTLGS